MPKRSSSAAANTTVVVPFPVPIKVKNPAAVALGRLGGVKGGKARAETLSRERRIEIARQAGLARQAKARIDREAEAKATDSRGSS